MTWAPCKRTSGAPPLGIAPNAIAPSHEMQGARSKRHVWDVDARRWLIEVRRYSRTRRVKLEHASDLFRDNTAQRKRR